ncbi:MAG: transglutaminaseTgpA domain-containing protein [Jiangellaceae bacterium]
MTARTRLTIVAALASALAILPLAPVTESHSWTMPALFGVALVAAVGLGLRRLHVPTVLVPVGQLAALVLWLGILVAGDVAWFGIVPTVSWAKRLFIVFGDGLDAMVQYAAPAPVGRGMLMLLVGGAGLVAVLVDFLAVGLRRVPVTGVALGAVYALAAAVVPGGLSWIWFVPPAVGFLALLVAEGRTRVASWGRSAGPSAAHTGIPETDSLARNGRRVGAVAVAVAVALPALLPGLTEGVFGRGGGAGSGGRTIHTDNPIVDLRRDLSRPENVRVFEYRADTSTPEYFREVALDVFDGERWEASRRPVPDSQRVSDGLPAPPGVTLTGSEPLDTYEIDVSDDYSSSWLPLPYAARTIEIDGDWRYDATTLDVVSPERRTDGASYTVQRIDLDPDAAELGTAGRPVEDFEHLLVLPDDLPDMVAELADEVTAEAVTDFDRAHALQSWFRTGGGFVYDLEVDIASSQADLVDFLTEGPRGRRGYCEQFAAAMAIMARTLNIPARVAVGYTAGERRDDGTWVVTTHDRHAWPELYFEGTGWVRWEPTPADRVAAVPPWTVPPVEGAGQNPGAQPNQGSPQIPAGGPNAEPDGGLLDEGSVGTETPPSSPWPVVALSVAAVAFVVALPSLLAWLRRSLRWRRASHDPVREAEAAWSDLRDAVRDAGLPWDPAATPRGTGRRLVRTGAFDADSQDLLTHLVTTTEHARYAARPEDTSGLRDDSAILRRTLLRTVSRARRAGAVLWPAATHDLVTASANRVADGLDWTDQAGERLRNRAGRLVPHRH